MSSVYTEIFKQASDDAVFWIGKVARMGKIEHPEIYDALLRFRGEVYVKELNFLDSKFLDNQGREIDKYDRRSISFAVVERVKKNEARIVGSIRLITKTNQDDPAEAYPIEQYFSELFDSPVGVSSAEISRFIVRYPELNRFQRMLSLSLIRAITLYAFAEKINGYYCLIEKPLCKLLCKMGIPLQPIGEPKYIEEQNGTLYPAIINAEAMIDALKADSAANCTLRTFFESDLENHGEGFYDASLIGGRK
jgi:N-acyl-L-homoserine lactone synthetase